MTVGPTLLSKTVGPTLLSKILTPRREIPAGISTATTFLVVAGLLGAWSIATYGGLVDTTFFPEPHEVLSAFWKVLLDGSLARNTWASLVVINAGFFLSSIVAVPLGILMGSYRIVQAAIEPLVNFIRYLPVTSMIPLLILWIGIGIYEKIAVIFIGTFFQQIVMVADTAAQVPNEMLSAAYTLGAKRRQVLTRVLLPATLPGIMDTLRVTMGWAWTYLVVAELVASNSGLGYMSMQAMRGLHADLIFVAILVIGILGMFYDLIFRWLKQRFLPWAGQR
jgi:NitT/TauT family transport system permease protein